MCPTIRFCGLARRATGDNGGEYNNGSFALTNLGAIYDPTTNKWTSLTPPKNWNYIGDSPSVVLPNGKFVVGNKLTKQMRELNPKTLKWATLSSKGKSDFNAEEGWTLLPDGAILTTDVKNASNSEIYAPAAKEWVTAGSTIVDLHSQSPFGCIHYGPAESSVTIRLAKLDRKSCAPMARYSSPDRIQRQRPWEYGHL